MPTIIAVDDLPDVPVIVCCSQSELDRRLAALVAGLFQAATTGAVVATGEARQTRCVAAEPLEVTA